MLHTRQRLFAKVLRSPYPQWLHNHLCLNVRAKCHSNKSVGSSCLPCTQLESNMNQPTGLAWYLSLLSQRWKVTNLVKVISYSTLGYRNTRIFWATFLFALLPGIRLDCYYFHLSVNQGQTVKPALSKVPSDSFKAVLFNRGIYVYTNVEAKNETWWFMCSYC